MSCDRWLVGVLLVWGASPAAALDPAVLPAQHALRSWGADDGVPQSSVLAVAQTPDGYVWLGTQGGLARFDGVRFVTFDKTSTPALGSTFVWALTVARDGSLWIGTNDGLVHFKDGTFLRYGTADGLAGDTVISVGEAADGAIWVGTLGKGASRYHDGRFTTFGTAEGIPAVVWGVYGAPDGTVWLGGVGGVFAYRDCSFTGIGMKHGLPSEMVTCLAPGDRDDLWVGTLAGAALVKGGKVARVYRQADGLGNQKVRAIRRDRHGSVWVATLGSGVFRVRGDAVEPLGKAGGLKAETVLAVFEDRDGGLWLGLQGAGVQHLRDSPMVPFTRLPGLGEEYMTAVTQAPDGGVWAGTHDGRLVRFDGRRFADCTPPGLEKASVESLFADPDGSVWFGHAGVLHHRRGDSLTSFPLPQKPDRPTVTSSIAKDADGRIWVGAANGLNRLDGSTFTTFAPPGGPGDAHVKSLCVGAGGTIWVATRRGVYRFRDGQFEPFTTGQGLVHDDVQWVGRGTGVDIWVGSKGGLSRIRDGRVVNVTARHGLPDAAVSAAVEDTAGHLWLACGRGVARLAVADFEAFADGRIDRVPCVTFGTADGLPSPDCAGGGYGPGAWADRAGRVWFTTTKGLAATRADQPPSPAVPAAILEGAISDGRVGDGPFTLRPGSHRVEFRFTAPTFADPGRLRFQYRLDGYDSNWQDGGTQRTATYTGLSPGEYSFRVRAVGHTGTAGEPSAGFTVVQQPHFTQTWWFRGCLLAAGLGLMAAVVRVRSGQLRARAAAVQAERSRIARELHDTLLQGVLGAAYKLQAVADDLPDRPDRAKVELTALLGRMDRSLAEARGSVADLRLLSAAEDVSAAVERAGREAVGGAAVALTVRTTGRAARLSDLNRLVCVRVCREAVTNAVRHGRATAVVVELAFTIRTIRLAVRDDGCGFEPHTTPAGAHFGLLGMKERAAAAGGHLVVTSRPGGGTTIELVLPRRRWVRNRE